MNIITALGVDPSSGGGTSSVGLAAVSHNIETGEETLLWGQQISFKQGKGVETKDRLIALHSFLNGQVYPGLFDVVVVEGQHGFGAGTKTSIIPLAQAAGVCLVAVSRLSSHVLMPTPGEVTTLKKDGRHKQVLKMLGVDQQHIVEKTQHVKLDTRSAVVALEKGPSKEGLNDVLDAISLARWGIKQELARLRRKRFESTEPMGNKK